MDIFLPEHQEILELFNKEEVRYLLIGGYAVNVYGYHRTTGDMDLWISTEEENIRRIQRVLLSVGFEEEDVRSISEMDFSIPQVFSIYAVPAKVDFVTRVNLIDFDEAWPRRSTFVLEDELVLNVVHYRDLVLMKMNTGRLKDKADVEEMQKIRREPDKSKKE